MLIIEIVNFVAAWLKLWTVVQVRNPTIGTRLRRLRRGSMDGQSPDGTSKHYRVHGIDYTIVQDPATVKITQNGRWNFTHRGYPFGKWQEKAAAKPESYKPGSWKDE